MYDDSYPSIPSGRGNPYRRCVSCRRTAPDINGEVERHYSWCAWRRERIAAHAFRHLNFRVSWSKEDSVFVARVDEHPDLTGYGPTPPTALKELMEAMAVKLDDWPQHTSEAAR